MKTAMQELIEDMKLKLDNNLLLKLNQSRFIPFLEKEKEQMLDFGLYVKKNGWVGCKIEDLFKDYNNQNK